MSNLVVHTHSNHRVLKAEIKAKVIRIYNAIILLVLLTNKCTLINMFYHLLLFTNMFQLLLVNSKNDKTYLSICICWFVTLV